MSDTVSISARLPEDVVARIDRAAAAQCRTRTGQLRHILLAGFERLAELEDLAGARLAANAEGDHMADRSITGSKQGTFLDSRLPAHGSVPVRDRFSPPPRAPSSVTPTSTKVGSVVRSPFSSGDQP